MSATRPLADDRRRKRLKKLRNGDGKSPLAILGVGLAGRGAPPPELSIILTVVDSGPVLRRCLEALKAQEDAPSMEVLVPFDDTVAEVANFAAEYPDFLASSRPVLISSPLSKIAVGRSETGRARW